MRTLFAKFLVWFWIGLAVLLGAEILLESQSLRRGLELRPNGLPPAAARAELARVRGTAGLDSLVAEFRGRGDVEALRVDADTPEAGPHADAVRAGHAALHSGRDMMIETHRGFYLAYFVGLADGRPQSLVLHPRSTERELLPFLPADLATRALLTLVLGGIGCFLLARYVTAPVIRLREATRRIAAGDLTARSGAAQRSRRDELEDLGRDFDEMAARLEASVGAQRRLLADISHELRSPLARMNVAVTLLQERLDDDPDGMLARLKLESRRLDRMIDDLLTLSRVESHEPVLAPQAVELGALAREIAQDARFEGAGHVADVRVTSEGPVNVSGDPGLLRSVLDNVVRNAVRHTAAGTTVEIGVARAADCAEVTIRDHGPGVATDQLEKIFEPFYRVPGAERSTMGTGLGLAIARRIIVQHRGAIRAGLDPGGGLCVWITLPAGAAA